MFDVFVAFVRQLYHSEEFIPLHEPRFGNKEKIYLNDCIDSTYVSSVGKYVDQFEKSVADFTGSKYAIGVVNGTAALHLSLLLAGVKKDELVITQPLTFIATANAIAYTGAEPLFLDVDQETLGLSPDRLMEYLRKETFPDSKTGERRDRKTGKRLSACVPVHTFGHPVKIENIKSVCDQYGITLVEDAAESLGSFYNGQHTGTFGKFGILSFNGNKIVTTGGGGMILVNDEKLARKIKHLSTQAKVPHRWEYVHDEIGYNYRLTNLQAAVGVAQLEKLPELLKSKRKLAEKYESFFKKSPITFFHEPAKAQSNYWLNVVILRNKEERDHFLEYTNNHGVMTRPAWELMTRLKMYQHCRKENLENAKWLVDRIVNIPSTPLIKFT